MFGIDPWTFPSAYTYDEVVKLYETSKPLKAAPDWRCLRTKRSNDATGLIRKDQDEYVFKLYRTEMVRWAPDRIEVTRHDSISSAGFVSRCLPRGFHAQMYASRMAINRRHAERQWVLNKVGDDWELDTTTLTQAVEYRLDRKVLAQMRKKSTPFIEYVKARNALTQQDDQPYRVISTHDRVMTLIRFETRLDDTTNFPKLYAEVKTTLTADELSKELPRTLTILAGGVVETPLAPGQHARNPDWYWHHLPLIST